MEQELDVHVTFEVGRSGQYDILVNGVLIGSRQTPPPDSQSDFMGFPDEAWLMERIGTLLEADPSH